VTEQPKSEREWLMKALRWDHPEFHAAAGWHQRSTASKGPCRLQRVPMSAAVPMGSGSCPKSPRRRTWSGLEI